MPRDVRLDGLFTLRSPLSHIGETISTTTYLVQHPFLQPDGSLEDVAIYAGNAWRGQLRDLSAAYMLARLGAPKLGLEAFHLLFSGGRIGGPQSTDLEQARRLRMAMPHLALFGGGVGTQILGGKLRVGLCVPLCAEASPALPERYAAEAAHTPYAGLTFEASYSRRDDTKVEGLAGHLAPPSTSLLEHGVAPARGRAKGADKAGAAPRDEAPQQMRMTSELLATGVRLHTRIDALDATDVEIGCLVAALHAFSRSPHIGGQASRGHGRVDLAYDLTDLETGESGEFLAVRDGRSLLTPAAAAAKSAYDQHLRGLYDAHLASEGSTITALLGAA